jgi:sugar phosphate isomerase/epimerase
MTRNRTEAGIKPLLPPGDILLAVGPKPDANLRLAAEYGVGAEIQTFAYPEILSKDFGKLLEKVADAAGRLEGPIGCHGAFFDTVHYSVDPEMAALARKRYLQSLEIASVLKASYIIFHSQYDPIIKVRGYAEKYHTNSMKFWPEIVKTAERLRIPIAVENMFDDSPEPIRRVCSQIKSPYFRVCLDVAHTAVWSKIDIREWVDAFMPYLLVTHLTDCHGEFDEHLGLGDGVLDLPRFISLVKKAPRRIYHLLETHDYMKTSLDYLHVAKRQKAKA